ncbi:MAG: PAS domain S-box protein [Sedimenticola sp.]|nr:PAS domain S-box protein [Sedimenticola sp.]
MNRQNRTRFNNSSLIAWLLLGLLTLSAILVLWVANSIRQDVAEINGRWQELGKIKSTKLSVVEKLHTEMGYGGLIHRYADLMLRGGWLNIEEIHEKIGSIEAGLEEYAAEEIEAREQRAIIGIRSVLDGYRENLRRADRLLRRGEESSIPRQQLFVDDRAAIVGMERLYRQALAEAGIEGGEGYAGQVNELRRVLGYGGMIHFMKYYLLTRDSRYRLSARQKLDQARMILLQLEQYPLDSEESLALALLQKTLKDYGAALDTVRELIAADASTHELDLASYVDDGPALASLSILKRSVQTHLARQSKQVGSLLSDIMDMTRSTVWVVVVLALLVLAAFYGLLNIGLLSLFSREKQSLQAQLGRMRDQLTDVLDISPFGFVITQLDTGKIIYANPAVSTMQGAPLDELIGTQTTDLFADPQVRKKYVGRLLDGELISNEPLEFRRRDGTVLTVLATSKLAQFQNQRVLFNWVYDISDRMATERLLAESEQMLNTILESIPIAIGIADKRSGQVAYCNTRGAELSGYQSSGEFIGKSSIMLWADDRQRLEYFNTFNQLGYVPEQEVQLLNADGYPFWALLGWESIQYHDREHVLFWFHDISERKHMQQDLLRSEQQLRTILESAPVGVGISDKEDGRLSFCNRKAAEIFGLTHQELMARSMIDFWNEPAQRQEYLFELNARGEVPEREVLLKRADGSHFWALLGWKSIRVKEREQILFWVYDYDQLKQTTLALEQAREEADRANRAKSIFFSNMSHELRTPMNSVIGFAQMLEDDPADPLSERQARCVGHIVKAGRHLLGLINELLDLSRLEAGRIDYAIENVSVDGAVDECLDLLAPLIEQHGIELVRFASVPAGAAVRADPVRLKQVLINLLTNAIKYNRDQKQVGVGCWPSADGMLRVFVADTGIGIEPDRLQEVFTLYRRLDERNSRIEGSGIGLAISHRLIEGMDGRIGVESRLGRGSVFWFELPGVGVERMERGLQAGHSLSGTGGR